MVFEVILFAPCIMYRHPVVWSITVLILCCRQMQLCGQDGIKWLSFDVDLGSLHPDSVGSPHHNIDYHTNSVL